MAPADIQVSWSGASEGSVLFRTSSNMAASRGVPDSFEATQDEVGGPRSVMPRGC
jgi:hypothetical protein